ncbi:MAG: hypothetical protein KJO11_08685 [Gemmatimonadetes bacterium]|nr:hypothetical protein [Gemmatimonadota bacterium]
MTTPSTARRLTLEAVVIIASILAAFAIDTWWDGRQEDRRQEALLRAIASDVRGMQDEGARVRGLWLQALDATEKVLAAGESRLTSADAPRVDSILRDLVLTPTFDAPTGALDALLRSDLGEVQSSSLVQSTTRLRAHIADLEREQQYLDTAAIEAWQYLATLGIDIPSLGLSWSTGRPNPVEQKLSPGWSRIGDPTLRASVYTEWIYLTNCLGVLDSIESELGALETELATRLDS